VGRGEGKGSARLRIWGERWGFRGELFKLETFLVGRKGSIGLCAMNE